MENYSLADLAAVTKDENFGAGMGSWWIIIFLIFMMGGGGWNRQGEFGQYATAASQNEILLGQRFSHIDDKIDRIGNGIADATFALTNTIVGEGRATQKDIEAFRYDMANLNAATNANVTAQTQKILDAMCADRMADMQARINQLETANIINSATAGVVKYPMMTTYSSGANPFCGCGCGYGGCNL